MIIPKLIQLPTHWELATWDDFTHVDHSGTEQMNMLMPYVYMDDDSKMKMARMQKQTDIEKLKELITKQRVYRISKASMSDTTPPAEFVRLDQIKRS